MGTFSRYHYLCALEGRAIFPSSKHWNSKPIFCRRFGELSLACLCGVHPSQSLPNKQVEGGTVCAEQAEGLILAASSLWPRAALSARPPIICPDGRARGPSGPFGTKRSELQLWRGRCSIHRVRHGNGAEALEARGPSLDSVLRAERQLEVYPHDHCSLFHGEKDPKDSTSNAWGSD